jgi:hypothetical protein
MSSIIQNKKLKYSEKTNLLKYSVLIIKIKQEDQLYQIIYL